jgi:2-polyprenyl-6-methoxyphenol hydroxylase-like FAD-dependent oxidoreductase
MDCMSSSFDICIRGSGVVGSTLALLLARQRLRVALVGHPAPATDVRAFALNAHSREILSELRCWPEPPHATAVQSMQVWGDAGGQVQFQAPTLNGLTHIVDVPALEQMLSQAVHFQTEIQRFDSAPEATLTVVCEGRNSQTRKEVGVTYNSMPYAQHALATRVQCDKPHRQQALQWFSRSQGELDILALLPLGGNAGQEAAVVWSLPSSRALALEQSAADDVAQALSQASQQALGHLKIIAPIQVWPLQLAQALQWSGHFDNGRSWVLAGDAAHSVHPLAGMGLNLGLADVSELASVLKERETSAYWRPLDDPYFLRRYERARKAGMQATWLACDGLQRLFNHPNPMLQSLRNWGLNGFNQIAPLKQWAMQMAMH